VEQVYDKPRQPCRGRVRHRRPTICCSVVQSVFGAGLGEDAVNRALADVEGGGNLDPGAALGRPRDNNLTVPTRDKTIEEIGRKTPAAVE